jgi:hypothetical protein
VAAPGRATAPVDGFIVNPGTVCGDWFPEVEAATKTEKEEFVVVTAVNTALEVAAFPV